MDHLLPIVICFLVFFMGYHAGKKRNKQNGAEISHYKQLLELLFLIQQKLDTMSAENKKAALDLINAQEVSTTNIRADIQRILATQGSANDGGLTKDEWEEVKSALTKSAGDLDTLDKENEPAAGGDNGGGEEGGDTQGNTGVQNSVEV